MSNVCEMLPWFAAGTLTHRERQQVLLHLAHCASCRQELPWLMKLGKQVKAVFLELPAPVIDTPPNWGLPESLADYLHFSIPSVEIAERVYKLYSPFGTLYEQAITVPNLRSVNLAAWLI